MTAYDPTKSGGVGDCPTPNKFGRCGCKGACAECGFKKHAAVHQYAMGGREGDPPWGHEFTPVPTKHKPTRTNRRE